MRQSNPATMPQPASAYAQIVETVGPGRRVLISGQIGITPGGEVLDGLDAQVEQAFRNLIAGAEAAGMGKADITKIVAYMVAPGDVGVYRKWRDILFEGKAPASTYVVVSALAGPAFLFEVEGEAFRSHVDDNAT